MNHIEELLRRRGLIHSSLFESDNFEYIHYFTQALRAQKLFHNDVDYVVQDGKVQIVDEFTGRILYGRRYSEGLHQAIEAKERIRIAARNRTLATITFQNFFRLYKKLSGMTGTADTEAGEFAKIYNLDVVVIPTNRPVVREDADDLIFLNEDEKFAAIGEEIKELHTKGQPVLVGTVSIEKSEKLSRLLTGLGIRHEVLNAKNHAREALIIAEAGARGSVTIATNMAGRGTDIKLGGNPEFRARRRAGTQATPEDVARLYPEELARWQHGLPGGEEPRRPARAGHRAARVAAHRQPAARALRPPGRPGLLALLHLAGRRADAPVRRREPEGADGPHRHEGRGADLPPLDQQVHRAGPEAGGGAQLRDPQAPAGVRRRAQRAAQVHLLPPRRDPGGHRACATGCWARPRRWWASWWTTGRPGTRTRRRRTRPARWPSPRCWPPSRSGSSTPRRAPGRSSPGWAPRS